MTQLQTLLESVSPVTKTNDNFETLSVAGIFGKRQPVTTGLTWGYYGGQFNGNAIADGTVSLTNTSDNYVVVHRSDGVVSVSTSATTNWVDPAYARLYKVTVAGSVPTVVVDSRWDSNGLFARRTVQLVSVSAARTFDLSDADTVQFHPAADTTARTWTIPANASVAYPIGTVITFDNDVGAGALTIAITTDTLVLVGAAGSTGSRTLAAGGRATAIKVTATRWRISGTAELS
jgi:hypothetical protein